MPTKVYSRIILSDIMFKEIVSVVNAQRSLFTLKWVVLHLSSNAETLHSSVFFYYLRNFAIEEKSFYFLQTRILQMNKIHIWVTSMRTYIGFADCLLSWSDAVINVS